MTENKKNVTSDSMWLISIVLSNVLVLASYFIYVFLPETQFANSLEYSGMTAVYVMLLAPLLCVAALAIYLFSALKLRASFAAVYKKAVVTVGLTIPAVINLICLIFEIMFIATLFKLGFAAPVDDTIYETYSIFIIISSVIQLLAWIVISIKYKGIKK